MKIKAVILENFRGYKDRTEVPLSGLTAFIGRNDAGKSTILEALDIFFAAGTVKIEAAGACINGNRKEVRIGVKFTDLPPSVVLDSQCETTLKSEYLLNQDGDFEVYKQFACSDSTAKLSEVYAWALHPMTDVAKDVLQMNQKALKDEAKRRRLTCKLTENPTMRKAIYKACGELQREPRKVPLVADNGKTVWDALSNYLTIYALFKSDREPLPCLVGACWPNCFSRLSEERFLDGRAPREINTRARGRSIRSPIFLGPFLQHSVQPTEHHERQDDPAVLRLLGVAPQQIGDGPDEGGEILLAHSCSCPRMWVRAPRIDKRVLYAWRRLKE